MKMIDPIHHRWSGWPGAWCLDCGVSDPNEEALAHGCEMAVCKWCNKSYPMLSDDPCLPDRNSEHEVIFSSCGEHGSMICLEPGSHRFDPYYRDPSEQYGTPEHEAWLIEMEQQEG